MESYKLKLLEWGLSSYLEAFEEEGIDEESFLLIDEETIKKIFQKSGPRLIFKKKFSEFLEDKTNKSLPLVVETESTVSTDTISSHSTLFTYEPDQEFADVINSLSQDAQHNPTTSKRSSETTGPDTKKFVIPSVFPQGLENVLKKYTDGQIVLCHRDKLSNDCRQKLCKIIVNELIALYGPELKSTTFIRVTEEIKSIFENEQADTYFIPYVSASDGIKHLSSPPLEEKITTPTKGHNPKGKLWSRYIYVRSALRIANSQKRSETKVPETTTVDGTSQETSYLDFLKVATEPYTKVIEAWEHTFKLRRRIYVNCQLSKIFDDFPCLRQNNGIELIETDFNQKFSDKIDIIYTTLPKVSSAILEEVKERKTCIPQISECDDNILHALMSLPFLFSPVTLKKSRKGGIWRPTRSEVAESFLLHIQTFDELNEKVQARRHKLEEYGLNLQPFFAVVGPLTNPEGFYIIIDEVKYRVDSVIRALELLFKFYHALDVEFPQECEHLWLFISETVFKIKPTKKNSATAALIADIKFHMEAE